MFKKIGPGVLVAAAFIGPGTVTTCTLAGATFGLGLLWAMLIAILATMVLQEMAARLGIVTQSGLADVVRNQLSSAWLRNIVILVISTAIIMGNAAYEAGNIGGAAMGLEALFGLGYAPFYPLLIGALASGILFFGTYKLLEKILVLLVFLMSISFLITALLTKPDVYQLLKGLFVPNIPDNGILTVIALVGTTVVPYNLFLHASLVSEKWKSVSDLPKARTDTFLAIAVGGLVSMSIIISATAMQGSTILSVLDLAKGLTPLFGNAARFLMGIGLFAAGITSAITAPLAAAYVANSCFGWKEGLQGRKFKFVWMIIILLGVLFLSFDINLMEIIKLAQVANGLLLPIIAVFLVWAVNRSGLMGKYKNTRIQNILGLLIILLAFLLGIKSIAKVFAVL